MPSSIPILGFAALSGMGKTTLLCRLLPVLREHGLRPAIVKHVHHDLEIDTPGKDSFELRKAGASPVFVASRSRWAMITETPDAVDPSLARVLAHLEPGSVDIVLVEGFKRERIPKIELHRTALGHPLLYPSDPDIIAVATDEPLRAPQTVQVIDLNDLTALVRFILDFVHAHGDVGGVNLPG